MTRAGTSRRKSASGPAGWGALGRTMVLEWQTRVVMRRITGMRQRSEMSKANRVRS